MKGFEFNNLTFSDNSSLPTEKNYQLNKLCN